VFLFISFVVGLFFAVWEFWKHLKRKLVVLKQVEVRGDKMNDNLVIRLEKPVNCAYEDCSRIIPEGSCAREQKDGKKYYCDLNCAEMASIKRRRFTGFAIDFVNIEYAI